MNNIDLFLKALDRLLDNTDISKVFEPINKKSSNFLRSVIKNFLVCFIFILATFSLFENDYILSLNIAEPELVQTVRLLLGSLSGLLPMLAYGNIWGFIAGTKKAYPEMFDKGRRKTTVFGPYAYRAQRELEKLYKPVYVIIGYVIILCLYFYFIDFEDVYDLLGYSYTPLLMTYLCITVLYRIESKRSKVSRSIVGYHDSISTLKDLKIVFWNDSKVYITQNRHFLIYDSDENKFIEIVLESKDITYKVTEIYIEFLDKWLEILLEYYEFAIKKLNEEKESLLKDNPINQDRIDEIDSQIQEYKESLEKSENLDFID